MAQDPEPAMLSTLLQLAEGNPGACTVLAQLMRSDPAYLQVLSVLHGGRRLETYFQGDANAPRAQLHGAFGGAPDV